MDYQYDHEVSAPMLICLNCGADVCSVPAIDQESVLRESDMICRACGYDNYIDPENKAEAGEVE